MLLLWLRPLPRCGGWTPASVTPSTEGRSSPTNTSISPTSSFVLPTSEWYYIFFSSGQVLLSALSWCSECTSVSECVFLMYPWREMYSTSTYSSPILFSLLFQLLISKFLSILSLRFLIFLQDLHPALKGISNHTKWSTHTQPYSDIVVCAQTGGWNLKKKNLTFIYLFVCVGCGTQAPEHLGSVVAACWLNCSEALWELSSPIRDQAQVPCIAKQILKHWTREGLVFYLTTLLWAESLCRDTVVRREVSEIVKKR